MKNKAKLITLAAQIGFLSFPPASFATPLIVGNAAPTIQTYDFATGQLIASFVPDGATQDGRGRAVEVVGNTVYYAAISGGIHLAPFNGGLGGSDFAVFPNPRPQVGGGELGVQDLDYHNGILYALTGYYAGLPIVYGLNPNNGQVLSTTAIQNHPGTVADGFTVLPNGDFLINDNDATPTYRGYDPTTGAPTGLIFTLPGGLTTGVDYNPADNSLYFFDFPGVPRTIERTTLTGTHLDSVLIGGILEDISVVDVPEPSTMALLGLGLAALTLARRRK